MLDPEEAYIEYEESLVKVALVMIGRYSTLMPADDIRQACHEGFLLACKSYDKRKGAGFKTYLNIRVGFTVIDALRKHRPFGKTAYKKSAGLTLTEYTEELHAVPIDSLRGDSYERLTLPIKDSRQRLVVLLYFQCDWDLVRIGKLLRISESRACQLKADAIKIMQKKHKVSP